MPLPVMDVKLPDALSGHKNGRLPADLLVSVPDPTGGPTVRLVAPAARAWRALVAAAATAGHVLQVTSSYRSYADQERLFRERYTTEVLLGRPSRTWDGRRWYLRPGMATAAVPGTSNHGLGIAVDKRNDNPAAHEWLLTNAGKFGWSWELQSEPWHLRYVSGDDTLEEDLTPDEYLALKVAGTPDNPERTNAQRMGDEWRALHVTIPALLQLVVAKLDEMIARIERDDPAIVTAQEVVDQIAERLRA